MVQKHCSPNGLAVRPRWLGLIPLVIVIGLVMFLLLALSSVSHPANAGWQDSVAVLPPSAPGGGCAPSWFYSITSNYGPAGIAYDLARNRLYIANQYGPDGGSLLMVYFDYKVYLPLVSKNSASGVGVSGRQVSLSVAQPGAVSGAFHYMTRVITGLPGVRGVAFDASRNRLYVGGSDKLYFVDGASFTVDPVKTVSLGNHANVFDVVYNRTADKIYISDFDNDKITIINAGNLSDRTTLNSTSAYPLAEPAYIAVNPTSNKVYVANHDHGSPSGWVSVISGETNQIISEVHFGGDLYGIAADSLHNRIYVSSISAAKVFALNGATDTALEPDRIEIRRASDNTPVPLRMIGVNPLVGTDTHIWLTTSSEDWIINNGWNRLILLSLNPASWPTATAPLAISIPPLPIYGLFVEPAVSKVWAASLDSNLVTAADDNFNLCPAPLALGNDTIMIIPGND